MAIIAVDSSGIIDDSPVWMVAVRMVNVQKHNALYLSENECFKYKEEIEINWREKLSSVLIFKSMEPLIKHFDMIQIDVDFLGWRKKYVEKCLKRLFGEIFYGKSPLSNPKIQFTKPEYSEDVKLADKKSKMARHREIEVHNCPNLQRYIKLLE